jgi:hypothetical protein
MLPIKVSKTLSKSLEWFFNLWYYKVNQISVLKCSLYYLTFDQHYFFGSLKSSSCVKASTYTVKGTYINLEQDTHLRVWRDQKKEQARRHHWDPYKNSLLHKQGAIFIYFDEATVIVPEKVKVTKFG